MAGGDFDRDGFADLAIGAPGNDVGPVHNAGSVTVLMGSANKLTDLGSHTFTQNTPGVFGSPERGDDMGWSVAAGDFGRDGADDLAVGNPFDNGGGRPRRGLGQRPLRRRPARASSCPATRSSPRTRRA